MNASSDGKQLDNTENLQRADRLASYLSERWRASVQVEEMRLVPGGAARATWLCNVRTPNASIGAVFRIDTGEQLLPTDEQAEYRTIAALHQIGFPVPEPLILEEDARWFGQPFSVVAEVPDCKSAPDQIPAGYRGKVGRAFWTHLGMLTRCDPAQIGVTDFLPATSAAESAKHQLDYWWKIFTANEIHANPIAHAAYRWLAENLPPPPARLCLVHGDYRSGNFLYSADGEIRAILDWEMAHLGDPLEDLCWSLDLRQNINKPELAGGLLPHREAVHVWCEASGLQIDPVAFRWWQVFAAFKGLTIWTLSAKKFQDDEEKRPVLARIGWLLVERQQRILLDYISPHSKRRNFELQS